MLGCVALAAGLLDHTNFVTAVVSGTLSAWTYFALRLYAGGYGSCEPGATLRLNASASSRSSSMRSSYAIRHM